MSDAVSPKPAPPARRDAFPYRVAVPTRFLDNDAYGHVNNVVYYAWFDTVINRYLVAEGGLDIVAGQHIGVCVESSCRYRKSVAFPADVEAGLRVAKIGTSSVTYALAIFAAGDDEACAEGTFVHVFVDRSTRRPTPLPSRIRSALERIA